MGIFFPSAAPEALATAPCPPLSAPSSTASAPVAADLAIDGDKGPDGHRVTFLDSAPSTRQAVAKKQGPILGRLIFAGLLLLVLLSAGIFTSMQHIDDWSKMLAHSFELVLGLILGILGGEAASRS